MMVGTTGHSPPGLRGFGTVASAPRPCQLGGRKTGKCPPVPFAGWAGAMLCRHPPATTQAQMAFAVLRSLWTFGWRPRGGALTSPATRHRQKTKVRCHARSAGGGAPPVPHASLRLREAFALKIEAVD